MNIDTVDKWMKKINELEKENKELKQSRDDYKRKWENVRKRMNRFKAEAEALKERTEYHE